MRLDKYLADMGIGTRSEIKKQIRSGIVTVNGIVVTDPGKHVTAESIVTLHGETVGYEEYVYYMLNKPAGVISASEDLREPTVVDLITEHTRKDIFPVGRLDRDTEGLLIITNDGEMAHRLLSPRHHVDKTYYARVTGIVNEKAIESFASGLVLPDGLECLPAELKILSIKDVSVEDTSCSNSFSDSSGCQQCTDTEVTIREGKFHQIKRMFLATGHEVIYLKRLSMGPITLDPSLSPSEYRRLTQDEITQLKTI